MNKAIIIGRLTADPEVRYTQNDNGTMAIGRYTLAADRRGNGTDFIRCVAFGRDGEFAEKYLKKGMKIAIEGRIRTGSYRDKDGRNVYTFEVVVERHEFCESKQPADTAAGEETRRPDADGFMDIPEGIDEELPFN